VQEHTGGVDHRRIGGGGAGAQRGENIALESLARSVDVRFGNLTGTDALPKLVNCGPARLHDRSVAVVVDDGPQGWEVEETMNRWDAPIVRCHEGHSSGDSVFGHPIGWRHGWS